MFFIFIKSEETTFQFLQNSVNIIWKWKRKIWKWKISNLLNNSEDELSRFATRIWYVIDSESKGKVVLSLTWTGKCLLATYVDAANHAIANAVSAAFTVADAKLYIPVVTLSTGDRTKLSNQLNEGFKRPVYWNEFKMINKRSYDVGVGVVIRELPDSSYQGVKRLFLLMIMLMVMQMLLI